MAVTVTYSWQLVQNLDLTRGPTRGSVDVTGLANGGFAAIGNITTTGSALDIFNAGNANAGGDASIFGAFGSLDQLSNGNIVATTANYGPTETFYVSIFNGTTGATILDARFVDDISGGGVDVAALANGGFVVVGGRSPGVSLNEFRLFNNAGTELLYGTFGSNQTGAVVAGLDDGGFAIAFIAEGANEVWTAVYNFNGTVRRAPAFYDGFGTINRNIDITATDEGFAIVYEDNEFSGDTDIALARFAADGDSLDYVRLTGTATIDETPQIARMADGLLAVSYGYSLVGPADSETFLGLYDPVTQTFLAQRTVTAGEPLTDDTDHATIASHGLGRVAVFHTNNTDNDADGEDLQAVRTVTGDADAESDDGSDFIDIVNGGGGGDSLYGRDNNDTLNGDAGDDFLTGGAGNDALNGGPGIDHANYSDATSAVTVSLAIAGPQNVGGGLGIDTLTGIENLIGSAFNDTLVGNSGNNDFFTGHETSVGNIGDRMEGGLGSDTYFIGSGYTAPVFTGLIVEAANAGMDTVRTSLRTFSLAAFANVEGLDFHGNLGSAQASHTGTGNGLDNVMSGHTNGDTLSGLGGRDTIRGEAGDDYVYGGNESGAGDILLAGEAGADRVYGGLGNDRIEGGADNDIWLGGDAGLDTVYGGDGNDRIDGGADSDTWLGGDGGLDYITGGLGNDRIDGGADSDTWLGGDAGADTITGGLGNDRIDGGAENDPLLRGDAGNDTITCGSGDDGAQGGDGNDYIQGQAGRDTIYGGIGADVITGGDEVGPGDIWLGGDSGIDRIYGGTGNDRIDGGADGDTVLNGDAGDDFITGGDGNDRASGGADVDTMYGQAGRDALYGGLGNDDLYGGDEVGAGDTWLGGDAGADFIAAGGGNDRLEGGTENDELWGGLGLDTSNGGAGADYFDYRGVAEGGAGEQIGDWQGGIDNLRIDASGFGGGLVAGALAANRLVIGTAATQALGQFLYNTANGVLYWDSNGTGAGGLTFLVKLFTPTFGAPPPSLATTDFEIVA